MDSDDLEASLAVSVLEEVWAQIQEHHPGVPDAVIVLAPGFDGKIRKLGHWAASRWSVGASGEVRGEVLVAGEGLREGAEDVLDTLLHEAAHALATARGVRDTSRQGRYHNARYKALAEEVGLHVEKVETYGWARTLLSAAAKDRYAQALASLADICRRGHRRVPGERKPGAMVSLDGASGDSVTGVSAGPETLAKKSRITLRCRCSPPRSVRIVPSAAALGEIVCGVCGESFDPDEAGVLQILLAEVDIG